MLFHQNSNSVAWNNNINIVHNLNKTIGGNYSSLYTTSGVDHLSNSYGTYNIEMNNLEQVAFNSTTTIGSNIFSFYENNHNISHSAAVVETYGNTTLQAFKKILI